MPVKRKQQNRTQRDASLNADLSQSQSQSSATIPKRQRVSRACDQCRAAREKCDGVQPQCFSCVSLDRGCTYNTAPKKRGVQTGLIRTLELALCWVFENVPGSEDALGDFLTDESRQGPALLLDKGNSAGNRLHKRWTRSKVHQEIDRHLSVKDGAPSKTYSSAYDSETDTETVRGPRQSSPVTGDRGVHTFDHNPLPRTADLDGPAGHGNAAARCHETRLQAITLPSNYWRLLDVYFAYTHCWLPILDRESIVKTASAYPASGLILDPEAPSAAAHAEVWAALAIASYQEVQSSQTTGHNSQARNVPPSQIYAIARRLVPSSENVVLDRSHLRSLVLLALVQMAQGKVPSSSYLTGLAVRSALQLRLADASAEGAIDPSDQRLLAACFILETALSLRMMQPPHLRASTMSRAIPLPVDSPDEWKHWTPCPGFGSQISVQQSAAFPAQPSKYLNQLFKFFCVLNENTHFRSHHASSPDPGGTAGLVRALDTEFSFCNSLVAGSTAPMVPSAYVIQATFLTASLLLAPDPRASVLWSFMEATEAYISQFGLCGAPPLFAVYMQLAGTAARTEALQESDRRRLEALSSTLQSVWSDHRHDQETDNEASNPSSHPPPQFPHNTDDRLVGSNTFPLLDSPGGHWPTLAINKYHLAHLSPGTPLAHPFPLAHDLSTNNGRPLQLYGSQSQGQELVAGTPLVGATGAMAAMEDYGAPGAGAGEGAGEGAGAGAADQVLDYDAMLDELASIDCPDSIEADPQFMANLGFAPGYDLGDFLRREVGSL